MAYKVGDKINIKKPKQENKYENTLKEILEILKDKNNRYEETDKLEVATMALQVLENWFLESDRES